MKKHSLFLTALFIFTLTWTVASCQVDKAEAPREMTNQVLNQVTNEVPNTMTNKDGYTVDEQAVYDTYRKFYEYKIAQNIQGLESILEDDFRLVHMTGYSQPRVEWLSQVADGQMRYFSDVEERVILHVEGDTATLQSRNKVDARIHGMRHVWNLELNFDMVKRNGQWIILDAVAHSY